MAVAVMTRVVIVDGALYRPRGLVWVWTRKVGTKFGNNTRAAVRSRTGQLRKGIRVTYRKPATKKIQATIGSTAPHTMYVLRGTHGPIMSNALWAMPGHESNPEAWRMLSTGRMVPRKGMTMAVGRNPFGPVTPMFRVSGQAANNFFYKGWVKTALAHPAIGKVPFPSGLS
jgi:hypothetical protein